MLAVLVFGGVGGGAFGFIVIPDEGFEVVM